MKLETALNGRGEARQILPVPRGLRNVLPPSLSILGAVVGIWPYYLAQRPWPERLFWQISDIPSASDSRQKALGIPFGIG